MKSTCYAVFALLSFAVMASGASAETTNIVHYAGSLELTGATPYTIGPSFISGSKSKLPTLFVHDTTVYQGDDLVQVGATNYTGGSTRHWGKVIVSNANWFATSTTKPAGNQAGLENGALYLGYKNGVGILEIQKDGFVSNKVVVGGGTYPNGGNGSGAVYVNPGAKLFLTTRSGTGIANSYIGLLRYGYLQQTGGEIFGQTVRIGGYGTGVFHMYGGEVDVRGNVVAVAVANDGVGTLYVTNGTVKCDYIQTGSGSYKNFAQVTVDGPNADVDTSTTFYANSGADNQTVVCLNNGGVLKIWKFYTYNTQAEYEAKDNPYCLVVSFNGGALKAYYNTPFFHQNGKGAKRVLVGEKGAILDTNGQTCELDEGYPLEGVVAGGIQSITLAEPVTGLTGAPFVRVLNTDDGAGYGAAAVADWDPETRTLKGIRVTSHGWGYTQGKVKVTISTYIWSQPLTGDAITVGDNTIGGFTKRGKGTLTSSAANTWQKWTRVEAGTLKVGVAGTIPANTELQLAGGDLDLNNIDGTTFNGVSGTGGKVLNGALKIKGEWKISAKKYVSREDTVVTGAVDLTECTKITLVDTDDVNPAGLGQLEIFRATEVTGLSEVPVSTPSNWKLAKTANGLTLRHRPGTIFLVR